MTIDNLDIQWVVWFGTSFLLIVIIIIISSAFLTRAKILKINLEKLQTLKTSEKRFRSLIETIDDSVILLDNDLKIEFANNKFLNLWNLNNSNTYNLRNLIDNNIFIQSIENIKQRKKSHKQDIQLKVNRNTYFFNISLIPQMQIGNNNPRIMIIFRDYTEKHKMEIKLHDLINVLKDQQKTLRMLSTELITAQENERKRISRELHDVIGQRLTAISLNLESVKSEKYDKRYINKRLKDSANLVVETIKEVQHFSFQLRPAILDDLGLIPAMKEYINAYTERTGINIKLNEEKFIEGLHIDIKTVLYRVFQESLNNVLKHSNATSALISFDVADNGITMFIKDNGIGFKKEKTKGLGIIGMQERLSTIGGKLSINSNNGKGTLLTISTPYDIIANDN